MAINVIKYLTECEQLYEVERIIESIQGCNGLCLQSNISSKVGSCGCSKWIKEKSNLGVPYTTM